MRIQVGCIILGGGLNARYWYDKAKVDGFIPVWSDGCILLYNKKL